MDIFLVGVSGNIVSAIAIALVPLTIIVVSSNRRQRQLATFFGLSSHVRSLHILLSRYQPEEEEEELQTGVSSRGYLGETVAVDEFLGAQALRDLFDSKWIVASIASIFDGLISGKRDFGRIQVIVSPVPTSERNIGNNTVVLMGTGARRSNVLAAELLSGKVIGSVFKFMKDAEGRAFQRMSVKGLAEMKWYAESYTPRELAVLQRITMADGSVTFLCAGKDVSGSRMAAEFLAWNWRALYEEFGGRNNGDFARLYAFHNSFQDSVIVDTVS